MPINRKAVYRVLVLKGCYLRQEFILHARAERERFFRSLKEECVWQPSFPSFIEARRAVRRWIGWYNERRPHQALGYLSMHRVR